MPEYPIGIDPTRVDTEGLEADANEIQQTVQEHEQRREAESLVEKEEQAADAQAFAEQQDPRNAKKWGIGAVTKEISSAVTGGISTAAGSVATFPERTVDAFSGEMAEVGVKNYRPDWNPFVD